MRKIFTLILALIFLSIFQPCKAEDMDFWDEPMKIDEAAKSQQKAVTDQEFEKVLKMFKKKTKEQPKPKGNPIGPQLQENQTPPDANAFKQTYETYPTVMIPVTLVTDNGSEIPPGYYRILAVKKDYGYFLNFYQGSSIIARTRAFDTGDDHSQKSLNYTKVIPFSNNYMKVIFGDIDCNIEAKLLIRN